MSIWAYNQCKDGNDTPEIRSLITDSYWAYIYIVNVLEIQKRCGVRLNNPLGHFGIVVMLKIDQKLGDISMKITNKYGMSLWAYTQCCGGNNTKEIKSLITDPGIAFWYCFIIEDDKEVRKYINNESDLSMLKFKREQKGTK